MEPIQSFEDFWPFYLSQHRHPWSRWLHFFGTAAAVSWMITSLLLRPSWFPLALVLGYGPAWVGHFFFEKNRPATFRYPLWSLQGDFKMWGFMVTGRLTRELDRLGLR